MADNLYGGVKVIQTTKENIDLVYKNGSIEIFDKRYNLEANQNQYVVLNDKIYDEKGEEVFSGSSSVITRVKGNILERVYFDKKTKISGICPRNKEQIMALDALLDPSVGVVTLTGSAGVGKTVLAIAAALHLVDQGSYERIILTRQMTQVGEINLGILPGEVSDKFGPYLKNYMCNFEFLIGQKKGGVEDLISQYNIEFVPFQLIRGASWPNTLVIADELQNATVHEVLTLGTRLGENSKLVMMGDMAQRDTKIAKDKTGLYKWINSNISRVSNLTSSIELIKCERGPIAKIFAEVLEEK